MLITYEKSFHSQNATGKRTRVDGDQLDTKQLLTALVALRRGDFSAHLPDHWTGVAGKIADTFNDVIRIICGSTGEFKHP